MIFVTGGAGFIGSHFIREWFTHHNEPLINMDKLTYASVPEALVDLPPNTHYHFVQGDIANRKFVADLFERYQPRAVVHFAAHSHVDRAISVPEDFMQNNIMGTFHLLEATLCYYQKLSRGQKNDFCFLHISTDEVYGALTQQQAPFSKKAAYAPNHPYSASKACSDHLVRAWHKTYGLPTLIAHLSNNYGPYQHVEKLIPKTIMALVGGRPALVYGKGQERRDWLYVTDSCAALRLLLEKGVVGQTYQIPGAGEKTNQAVVKAIYDVLVDSHPTFQLPPMQFIKNRLGHDFRYAMRGSSIQKMGWKPLMSFEDGIQKTVQWYCSAEVPLRFKES